MPSNPLSLQLTDQYRQRLDATRERIQSLAVERWPTIEALDSTDWSVRMAQAVEQGQTEAIRATAGYLSAFLTLELGKRTKGPAIDSRLYAGKAADGGALASSLESPLIGVLWRLKGGSSPEEALAYGLDRAKRQVGMDLDAAHRAALLDGIQGDERFAGWQRATSGTCGACLGTATGLDGGLHFQVHPNCKCVSEPVVGKDKWYWKDDEERFAETVPAGIADSAPTDAGFVEAAKRYTGQSEFYRDLNERIAQGLELTPEQAQVAQTLRASMKDLPEQPTVWRGIKPEIDFGPRVLLNEGDIERLTADWAEEKFKPGSIISTKGFQSSSFNVNPALNGAISRDQPGIIFEILANNGSYLGKATKYDDEAELLLPDHARFRVRKVLRGVRMGQDGGADAVTRTVVQLEQI